MGLKRGWKITLTVQSMAALGAMIMAGKMNPD
jgi:hypothetical protein